MLTREHPVPHAVVGFVARLEVREPSQFDPALEAEAWALITARACLMLASALHEATMLDRLAVRSSPALYVDPTRMALVLELEVGP